MAPWPPVLMFIHGGFWKSLDAATFSFVGGAFAPAGALVAVIDYPLIPDVSMSEIVRHVGLAIRWLSQNARSYGGDPRRIHVAGHSAGGQLAAIALDGAWQATHGIPAGAVSGAIAISGVFELEPLRRSFQQESLQLTAEDAERWSPLRHIPPSSAATPPLVVAVAGAETQEFIDQSIELATGFRDNGHTVEPACRGRKQPHRHPDGGACEARSTAARGRAPSDGLARARLTLRQPRSSTLAYASAPRSQ